MADVSHKILPYGKRVYILPYHTSQDGMPHVDDIVHHAWHRSYSRWGQYISYVISVLRDGSTLPPAEPASNSRDGCIDANVGTRMRVGQQSTRDDYRLLYYLLQRFHQRLHCHRTTTT